MADFLFLDDFRMPIDAFYYTANPLYTKTEWVIVRDYNQFVQYINEHGLPALISFDHDLADTHYDELNGVDVIDYDNLTEKTGYDCARWLIEYCLDHDNMPLPNYFIHSMNRVGAKNISSLLENYNKHIKE